jgi:periplasmic nitrate reductase NapE
MSNGGWKIPYSIQSVFLPRVPEIGARGLIADRRDLTMSTQNSAERSTQKASELYLFLFLTVVLAPALSVAIVGGYGLTVWMYQLIAGPPTL